MCAERSRLYHSPSPPASPLRGCGETCRLPRHEPHLQAAFRTPRLGRAQARRGDRPQDRPDAYAGRHRHDGLPAVRAHGRRSRQDRALGLLRRPQHGPGRLRERRRPRLPPVGREEVRHRLLPPRQRHLPPAPPRALREARQDAHRLRFAHADGRRHRHARDGRGRSRRRGRHGGRPLLHHRPARRARVARGRAPPRRLRQGRHPRRPRQVRLFRKRRPRDGICRSRRRLARRPLPRHHHEHGHGTRRHDVGLPLRRRDAPFPRRAGPRAGLDPARRRSGRGLRGDVRARLGEGRADGRLPAQPGQRRHGLLARREEGEPGPRRRSPRSPARR